MAIGREVSSVATKEQKEEEKKWKVESDLRAIKEANEIKKDKSRMADVEKLIAKEMKALAVLDQMFPTMGKNEE